ncbi:MAG: hypothetical protein HQM15_09660 [Deltaproteobacteria bacterium]|nr:hypothetical protein [Deltaproteobacteria bacterium]
MQTIKEDVKKILSHLPDTCTLEDVQYHLYVLQKIKRAQKQIERGEVVSQEEVEKEMNQWLEE